MRVVTGVVGSAGTCRRKFMLALHVLLVLKQLALLLPIGDGLVLAVAALEQTLGKCVVFLF